MRMNPDTLLKELERPIKTCKLRKRVRREVTRKLTRNTNQRLKENLTTTTERFWDHKRIYKRNNLDRVKKESRFN